MKDESFSEGEPEFKIEYYLKEPSILPTGYSKYLANSVNIVSEICHFYYPSRGLNLLSRTRKNDELKDIALKLSFNGILKFPEVLISQDAFQEIYQRRYEHIYRGNKNIPLQGYELELDDITSSITKELDNKYPFREGNLIVSSLSRTSQNNPVKIPYDLEFMLHIETVKEIKIDISLSKGNIIYQHGKPKSEGLALPMIGIHISNTMEEEEVIEHLTNALQDVVEETYETTVVLESSKSIWISNESQEDNSDNRRTIN